MWHSTVYGPVPGRRRPGRSRRRPRAGRRSTTTRRPASPGGTLTTGVGPGGASSDPGLRGRPGGLRRRVADDRLVGVEAAVDDVEQDRLARDEVEHVRQERVVLRDEVDLARLRRRTRRRRVVWPAAAAASQAATPGHGGDQERRRREEARRGRTGSAGWARTEDSHGARHVLARSLDMRPGASGTVRRPGPGARDPVPCPVSRSRLAIPTDSREPAVDPSARSDRGPSRGGRQDVRRRRCRTSRRARPIDAGAGRRRHGGRRHRPRHLRRRVLLDARPVRVRARRRRCG